MKEFEGKVAVITGAGNGFGVEIAKECAYRKIKMILVDIEKEDVELTKKMVCSMGGEATGYGTHEELLKNCQTYREIYNSQYGKKEEA